MNEMYFDKLKINRTWLLRFMKKAPHLILYWIFSSVVVWLFSKSSVLKQPRTTLIFYFENYLALKLVDDRLDNSAANFK